MPRFCDPIALLILLNKWPLVRKQAHSPRTPVSLGWGCRILIIGSRCQHASPEELGCCCLADLARPGLGSRPPKQQWQRGVTVAGPVVYSSVFILSTLLFSEAETTVLFCSLRTASGEIHLPSVTWHCARDGRAVCSVSWLGSRKALGGCRAQILPPVLSL